MVSRERWSTLLESTGALQSGHFLLSSGRHSGQYVQCARVLERPKVAAEVGTALAARLPWGFDRVASPPLGALLIGYEVARHHDVPFLFAERADGGPLGLRRGFTVAPGERIAIVEDVITTGRTTGELVDLMERLGAVVVGVAAIVDRSTDHRVRERPIESLLRLSIPTYALDECPLCAAGAPITKPGSRATREEVA
jgi:orotate phosphoribosyltransferase